MTTTLWWSSKAQGDQWVRVEVALPNLTSKYFFQFEARMGMRIYSDVAMDDFSLAPECFGLNMPPSALQGYNYWDPMTGVTRPTHMDFLDRKCISYCYLPFLQDIIIYNIYFSYADLELTSCGAVGSLGPSHEDCIKAYTAETMKQIKVFNSVPYKGVQVYTVPNEGYYT